MSYRPIYGYSNLFFLEEVKTFFLISYTHFSFVKWLNSFGIGWSLCINGSILSWTDQSWCHNQELYINSYEKWNKSKTNELHHNNLKKGYRLKIYDTQTAQYKGDGVYYLVFVYRLTTLLFLIGSLTSQICPND